MKGTNRGRLIVALLASSVLAACSSSGDDAAHQHGSLPPPVIPEGAMYTAADVHFMQGMIAHHGQAIMMTNLALTRNASDELLRFAQKIDLSQTSEIELMQTWLRERKQAIPDSNAHHSMAMPGMLTPEQLKQLQEAKGAEFDRLFLIFMIQHHEGALKMVEELRANPMALQDTDIYVFSNDVDTDQRAEIERMHVMLDNY